ncbi:hypothetical protein ACFVHB_36155 [Kitasatospora sp. NPDC127111]|uniref:hypothetical protein n=1 Tax=Kitasatospora sp. NPDC127111 TaxID=3345363 RepID=UPI00362583A8
MSDQRGHREITRQIVDRLYETTGEINGMTAEQFYERLNQGQAGQDDLASLKPYYLNREGQAEHSLAEPAVSAQANVERIVSTIVQALEEAGAAALDGRHTAEAVHLGEALHPLEDSYGGHVHRSTTADPGDPRAPIEGINVFDPLSLSSRSVLEDTVLHAPEDRIGMVMGTHDLDADAHRVDETGTTVLKGYDYAAVAAGTEVLDTYLTREATDSCVPRTGEQVAGFFRLAPDARVHHTPDQAWVHERNEQAASPGMAEITHTPGPFSWGTSSTVAGAEPRACYEPASEAVCTPVPAPACDPGPFSWGNGPAVAGAEPRACYESASEAVCSPVPAPACDPGPAGYGGSI